MRELYLLRHAEALSESPTGDDCGRPLSRRGQDTALRLGQALADRGWFPQFAKVSSAVRTQQTWNGLTAGMGDRAPASAVVEMLYNASAGRVLDIIRDTSDGVVSLIIVGHNPSMHELALRLSGDGSDERSLHRMRMPFPTAGLARFEFEGEWEGLNPFEARLTHFLRPQDLPE